MLVACFVCSNVGLVGLYDTFLVPHNGQVILYHSVCHCVVLHNSQLLEQRKVTRNTEWAFIKYTEDHHWREITRKQNRYNRMLEFNKTDYIITKVSELANNSRQLFKLVLGKNSKPPSPNNSQLAENFAEFFHAKTEKIVKSLKILNHIHLDN